MIFHQPVNSRGNFNYNTYIYSGREYAPHFHKNMELICILRGVIQVTVNGATCSLSEGKAAMILSNQIHSFVIPADSEAWVAVFSEEYVPAFVSAIKGKQGKECGFVLPEDVMNLVKTRLIDENSSRIMRKACFYAVCDQFLQQVPLEVRQEKSSFLVGQLLDWIAQHYTEDFSLKQAAEIFGYEYHYLSRLLNKNFAISFTQLLSGYRVEHALQLLESTALPITQVAEQSGFQSIRSFNLIFKKHTGKTPADYRSAD